ncbi:hypothetical protein KY289_017029 [Solanum tuberosum]|nr:hypothetical protein KY284_016820 [Solanum tuberosum]KAH0689671.1 hypothetical protein KY289_017029 [Solanum tuberosum]
MGGIGDDLEIFAPYIQHLEISGEDLKCRPVNMSSVVNAKLIYSFACIKGLPSTYVEDYCHDYHQRAAGLLRASPHVETISIELEYTLLDDFPIYNFCCNSELLDLGQRR